MRIIITLIAMLVATSCQASQLPALPAENRPEDAKSGAVLCGWMILASMEAYAKQCHPSDLTVRNSLNKARQLLDDFIVRNSTMTLASLQDGPLRKSADPGTQCTGDAERMYQSFAAKDGKLAVEYAVRMTAIPRRPVADPCL
jgi:hypothetical protein